MGCNCLSDNEFYYSFEFVPDHGVGSSDHLKWNIYFLRFQVSCLFWYLTSQNLRKRNICICKKKYKEKNPFHIRLFYDKI